MRVKPAAGAGYRKLQHSVRPPGSAPEPQHSQSVIGSIEAFEIFCC
eukprot:COSAG01_NODE_937_length_12628_cov_12.665257_3_plen_46_part_00